MLDIDFYGNVVKLEEKVEDISIYDEFILEDLCCSNLKCEGENLFKSFFLEILLVLLLIILFGNIMVESGDKIIIIFFDDIFRLRCLELVYK